METAAAGASPVGVNPALTQFGRKRAAFNLRVGLIIALLLLLTGLIFLAMAATNHPLHVTIVVTAVKSCTPVKGGGYSCVVSGTTHDFDGWSTSVMDRKVLSPAPVVVGDSVSYASRSGTTTAGWALVIGAALVAGVAAGVNHYVQKDDTFSEIIALSG